MIKLHEGTEHEIAIRLVVQSPSGNEFFDDCEDMNEMVSQLQAEAMAQTRKDGIERLVGFAIVPNKLYGQEGSYGAGMNQEKGVENV